MQITTAITAPSDDPGRALTLKREFMMANERLRRATRSPHRERVVQEWPNYWLMDKPQEYPWIGVRMRKVTLRAQAKPRPAGNARGYHDI